MRLENLIISYKSLAKNTSKTSLFGLKPITQTKVQDLHFAPQLTCDSTQFSNTSYISEPFVKSLTKIKGKDNLDTTTQIINTILRKMGYNHPEALKIEQESPAFIITKKLGITTGFLPELGSLYLSNHIINSPIEQQIPLIYHEMDHLDKHVKIYKTIGEKTFQELLNEFIKNSPFYEAITKCGILGNSAFNKDFYRKMSEGINIQNFDVKKWSKAFREYSGTSPRFIDQYKYYNNPLEISAYNLQSKINKILGLPTETTRDTFPKNFMSMINSLKRQGITDLQEQEMILQETINTCQLKYIDNRLIGILKKKFTGEKITPEEIKLIQQSSSDFQNNISSNLSKLACIIQKASLDAEQFINKGIFTSKGIICSFE